jgi:hypothetical protein
VGGAPDELTTAQDPACRFHRKTGSRQVQTVGANRASHISPIVDEDGATGFSTRFARQQGESTKLLSAERSRADVQRNV